MSATWADPVATWADPTATWTGEGGQPPAVEEEQPRLIGGWTLLPAPPMRRTTVSIHARASAARVTGTATATDPDQDLLLGLFLGDPLLFH